MVEEVEEISKVSLDTNLSHDETNVPLSDQLGRLKCFGKVPRVDIKKLHSSKRPKTLGDLKKSHTLSILYQEAEFEIKDLKDVVKVREMEGNIYWTL